MSCVLEHREDFGGGEAAFAQGAEGEGVVAFGEADSCGVGEQAGVEVRGGGEAEGALQEDLAGGGFQEVAAADDFGDAHGGVVDYAGELVAGDSVFTPDEEVAEVFAGGERLGAEGAVFGGYGLAVRDAEAVVGVGSEGWGGA